MTGQADEVKVVSEVNCNNAPKKALLRDLNIASIQGDFESSFSHLDEAIVWNIIGGEQLEGLPAIEEKLTQMLTNSPTELHIFNIITHGNTASVNGKLYFQAKHPFDFCHIYTFKGHGKNAKIKEMTSYIIETND